MRVTPTLRSRGQWMRGERTEDRSAPTTVFLPGDPDESTCDMQAQSESSVSQWSRRREAAGGRWIVRCARYMYWASLRESAAAARHQHAAALGALDREPTMLDPEAREKARVHGEAPPRGPMRMQIGLNVRAYAGWAM